MLHASDFVPAFVVVGICAAVSALAFVRLPAGAGAEVSGHRHDAPLPASGAAQDR